MAALFVPFFYMPNKATERVLKTSFNYKLIKMKN